MKWESCKRKCAISNKLWARQEVQDAAEWVSSHGIGVRFSFSSLGWPPSSSHLQVLQMRLFLSGQKFCPSSMSFQLPWPTFDNPVRSFRIGQQQEPPFKWDPSWGEGVVKKVVCLPIIALNPALHLQPLFTKKKKKQTKPYGNRWSKLTQVAHPNHGLESWSAIGEQNTKVTSSWGA